MITTVKAKGCVASYSVGATRRSGIQLPNYIQQDYHSCGFIAALTITKYLIPTVKSGDVLAAVQPKEGAGTPRKNIVRGLAVFGIEAVHRKDLSIAMLRKLVLDKVPVIISVWPDGWSGDHWTVVQDMTPDMVYLTNHYSLSLKDFKREWTWREDGHVLGKGEGLVCTLTDEEKK